MSHLEAGWGNNQNICSVWKCLSALSLNEPVVQHGEYANPPPGWCAIITCDYCSVQLMSQPGTLATSETSLHPAHLP